MVPAVGDTGASMIRDLAAAIIRDGKVPRWLSWMRRPTGDQEVAGSIPAEVGNIRGDQS